MDLSADATPEPSNVIDLMAALKKSLGQPPEKEAEQPKRKKAAASNPRQTGLKLPIKGGRTADVETEEVKPRRKRA